MTHRQLTCILPAVAIIALIAGLALAPVLVIRMLEACLCLAVLPTVGYLQVRARIVYGSVGLIDLSLLARLSDAKQFLPDEDNVDQPLSPD